jgi:hypothetical protein
LVQRLLFDALGKIAGGRGKSQSCDARDNETDTDNARRLYRPFFSQAM